MTNRKVTEGSGRGLFQRTIQRVWSNWRKYGSVVEITVFQAEIWIQKHTNTRQWCYYNGGKLLHSYHDIYGVNVHVGRAGCDKVLITNRGSSCTSSSRHVPVSYSRYTGSLKDGKIMGTISSEQLLVVTCGVVQHLANFVINAISMWTRLPLIPDALLQL